MAGMTILGEKNPSHPLVGQNVQVQCEHQQHDRRGDEHRQRLKGQGDGHNQIVPTGALAQRGQQTHRDADAEGDDDGGQVELH